MGSRTDIAELLSQCRWSEEGSYLGEISKSSGFPCVAKVSRGQYVGLGQPSFSNPSLVSHVLLVSAGKQLSAVAQCVKFKNNARQRVVPFGPTLVIPQDFEGHFEILNEDGKAVPCIESVEALARRFPDSCLVREPLKGYKPDVKSSPLILNPLGSKKDPDGPPVLVGGGGGGGHAGGPPGGLLNNTNYRISDKSRVVTPGEILVLVGEVSVPTGKNKVSKYLRCFDSKGQTVFLASNQKGKFSPLARQESISGVHTTKNILNKRMPLMVRLVDGKSPVMPSSKSSSFKFVPELRLYCTLQEELIFGMPLSQSSKETQNVVPMPLSVPLKFQVCRNMGEVEQLKEFSRVYERVKSLVNISKNFIQIYDINLKKELRFDGRQWKSYAPPIFLSPSLTDPQGAADLILNNSNNDSSSPSKDDPNNYNDIPDVQDYEDIDQIYDYVRGIKPPPAKFIISNSSNNNNASSPVVVTPTTEGEPIITKPNHRRESNKVHSNKEKISATSHHHAPAVVTIKTSGAAIIPSTKNPDVIPSLHSKSNKECSKKVESNNYSNLPPPVPKHIHPVRSSAITKKQLPLRPSKSVEKLFDNNYDDDDRPTPPPIETIPSLQNKFHIHQQQKVSNGVSVSVTNNYGGNHHNHHSQDIHKILGQSENNNKKMTSKTLIDNDIYVEDFVHHHHSEKGTQIQIQIRSDHNNVYSNTNDGGAVNEPSSITVINSANHGRLHKLDSTGGSISTSGTPTNTSGSSQSKSSGCSGLSGDQNGKGGRLLFGRPPKTHLYIKHSGNRDNNSSSNTKEVTSAGGVGLISSPSTDPTGHGLSGSPTNRIIFRRSPIFDCRYKSMNDLNRSSLAEYTSSNGSSGGSARQKYFQPPSNNSNSHLYNNGSTGSSGYHRLLPAQSNKGHNNSSSRDNLHHIQHQLGSSHSNLLNVNFLNNNKSSKSKPRGMIFRPKSLTNIALDDGLYSGLVFGNSNNHGGSSHHLHHHSSSHGITGGVKKKLADMVVPSHHHAIHTPPPPPIELMTKVQVPIKSSSQRNSSHKYKPNFRKASIQSANLFL